LSGHDSFGPLPSIRVSR